MNCIAETLTATRTVSGHCDRVLAGRACSAHSPSGLIRLDSSADRDEHRRADAAALRMLPAHQRLERRRRCCRPRARPAGNAARSSPRASASRKSSSELAALLRAVLEFARIEPELPAAAASWRHRARGRTRGSVRPSRCRRKARSAMPTEVPMIARCRRSNRAGEMIWMTLPASSPSFAAVVEVGQDDLELVAAQAADLAAVADDRAAAARRPGLQQLVARRMAQRIVDLLEAVEVEHHQRAAALGALVGGRGCCRAGGSCGGGWRGR